MARTGERWVPMLGALVITVLIGVVVGLVSVGARDAGAAADAGAPTAHDHHQMLAAGEPHIDHVATEVHEATAHEATEHDATAAHVPTDAHEATAHDATVHDATDVTAPHDPTDGHDATQPHEPPGGGDHEGEHPCELDDGPSSGGHHQPCEPLTPYSERYAAATPADRATADRIVAGARAFVAPLTGPSSYRRAGFRSPVLPGAIRHEHWRHTVNVADGVTLDPSRPEGLVEYAPSGQPPQVVGIFFAAAAGQPLPPTPAGDLMQWHSHDASCSTFYVTEAEPCTDTIRMMHVFTFDQLTYSSGAFADDVELRVADPFAAPTSAAVEIVD